jgi:hypothetical protein
VTPTNTPTPSVTPTITPTNTETPTNTPTPTVTPTPVTGYGFNLVALPYNFPSSGNTIMNQGDIQTGTTNPNELTISGGGIYFNSIDSNGIDRTSYFSGFTGQSVTITMSQTGSTAIYSGSTNAFQSWSANTGTVPPGEPGTGFVFGTGISTVPSGVTGTTVLIQSATTQWVTGQTVYISVEINVPVTPTPTPTPTTTLTPTPTLTPTETPTSGYQTITGYYNSISSLKFCTDVGNTSFTVYTSTYTTLANIYSNSASIYSNTSLSSLASAGFYGVQNGGSGNTWYQWNGTVWIDTNTCA